MSTQELIEALRRDAGDLAIVKRGEQEEGRTYSWDQSHERAWAAADLLEASLPREDADLDTLKIDAEQYINILAEENRTAGVSIIRSLLARVRTAEAQSVRLGAAVREARDAMPGYFANDAAFRILHEALASRTVETAEEWEYGNQGAHCLDYDDRRCRDVYPTLAELSKHEEDAHAGIGYSGPRRRHPASAWEPVPPTPETEGKS